MRNQNQTTKPKRKIRPLDLWSGVFDVHADNNGVGSSISAKRGGLKVGAFIEYDLDDKRPTFGGRVKWTF